MSAMAEETNNLVVDDDKSFVGGGILRQVDYNENEESSPEISEATAVQDTIKETEVFDDPAVTNNEELQVVVEEEMRVEEDKSETEVKNEDGVSTDQSEILIAANEAFGVAEERRSDALVKEVTSKVTEETELVALVQGASSEVDSIAVAEDFISGVTEEVNLATGSVVTEESDSTLVTEETSSAADSTSLTYEEEKVVDESFTENLTLVMTSGSGTVLETTIRILEAVHNTQETFVVAEDHSVEVESAEQLINAVEEAVALPDDKESIQVASDETPEVTDDFEEMIVAEEETLKAADLIEATVVTANEINDVVLDQTEALTVDSSIKGSYENLELMNFSEVLPQENVKPSNEKQAIEYAHEITKAFAEKYIQSLEEEWQLRRSVWMEGVQCSPDQSLIGNSPYSYETFVEAVGNGKIALQVPFVLPEVTRETTAEVVHDTISEDLAPSIVITPPEEEVSGEIPKLGNVDLEEEEKVPLEVQVPVAIDIAEVNEIRDEKDVPFEKETSEVPVVAPIEEIFEKFAEPEVNRSVGASERYEAVVNGRNIPCSSLEHKIRVENAFLKLITIQSYAPNLKEMTVLPGVQVLRFLDLEDFKNCRLVSQSWNAAVINSNRFLGMTTFVLQKKALRAMATLENSKVRWQNLRCSIIPSVKLCSVYDKRFLSTLRVTASSSRREPLSSTLTTVVLEDIDIDKQQLVRWIQSCKRLSYIEVRNCNFLRTSVSVNMDKANTILEKVHSIKFSDMDAAKLADALRFFLPATRQLHTLEMFQRKETKGGTKPRNNLTVRKGAEEDVAGVLCSTLKKNSKTLKNIAFEFASAKNNMLQQTIVDTLQAAKFQMNTLVVRSSFKVYPLLKIESCAM